MSDTSLPSLQKHRQQVANLKARASRGYGAGDDEIHTGNWIPFDNNHAATSLLPGPNGGNAVGLPNYVPFGHPSLKEPSAREKFGDRRLFGSGNDAHDLIGLEGKPYESRAEKNKREMMIAQHTKDLLTSTLTGDSSLLPPTNSAASALSRIRVAAAVSNTNKLTRGGGGGGMPHFDVEKYMRSNHRMLSNVDRLSAAEVLRIEPFDRDPSHIATLSKFLGSIDFFAGLAENLRADIAGVATMRVCRKDEVIYLEGEDSLQLFVILTGSVGTRVKEFIPAAQQAALLARGIPVSGDATSVPPTAGTSASIRELNLAGAAAGSFVAAVIGPGECFGQETMGVTEDRTLPRTQTKVSLERTELLVVDVRDYKSLLRIAMSKESSDKMDFVALLPIFEMCTMRELHRIATCLTRVTYPKNHVIIKQGEASDKVYFIQSGECRVVHKIYSRVPNTDKPLIKLNSPIRTSSSNHMSRRTRSADWEDDEEQQEEEKDYGASTGHYSLGGSLGKGGGAAAFERARAFALSRQQQQSGGGGQARPIWGSHASPLRSSAPVYGSVAAAAAASQNFSQPKTVLQPQLLDLGRLGPRWFFGEMGVLQDAPRSASVYAETNVTLMVMSKEDFFTRLPPFCLKYIEDYIGTFYAPEATMKEQWQQQKRWQTFKSKMMQTNKRTGTISEINKNYSNTLNAIKH